MTGQQIAQFVSQSSKLANPCVDSVQVPTCKFAHSLTRLLTEASQLQELLDLVEGEAQDLGLMQENAMS